MDKLRQKREVCKTKKEKYKKQMRNNRIVISILQRRNFTQKPEIGNHTAILSSTIDYIYSSVKNNS